MFYQLALSLNITDRGLRARVRAVLDKQVSALLVLVSELEHLIPFAQVISHYGAEPGGKRTRKQYHP